MFNSSISTSSTLSGMVTAATAFALLTATDTIFKLIVVGHPAYQILLINACFALIPILIWGIMTGGVARFYTLRLPQHLARGATSVMSAFAAIYAYARLPLTDFYAIVFAGPLIVTALSAFWLGERVDRLRWLAIVFGFSGILIVANPFAANDLSQSAADITVGRFAALISIFCYSLSVIMIRRMRSGESNLAFSFYGYLMSLFISGILLWFRGGPALVINDLAHLALSGVLAGIASICLMTAYHRAPVALVAPFQYTQIIWGAIAGYFLWAHIPDMRLVTGAAMVAASGLFIIYREIWAKSVN